VGISTVYGKEYYQITPMVNGIEWSDMLKWCFDMFGPSGTDDRPGVWSYNERWYANNGMFLFKDKKDCEWFLLRWQ
jgi:hypothetical protein